MVEELDRRCRRCIRQNLDCVPSTATRGDRSKCKGCRLVWVPCIFELGFPFKDLSSGLIPQQPTTTIRTACQLRIPSSPPSSPPPPPQSNSPPPRLPIAVERRQRTNPRVDWGRKRLKGRIYVSEKFDSKEKGICRRRKEKRKEIGN